MRVWVIAAGAMMGVIVLFVGVPLSTWAKSLARRGARWTRAVFVILPLGALTAFLLTIAAGFAHIQHADPAHPYSKVHADAVAEGMNGGALGIAGTIAIALALLAIAEACVRLRRA